MAGTSTTELWDYTDEPHEDYFVSVIGADGGDDGLEVDRVSEAEDEYNEIEIGEEEYDDEINVNEWLPQRHRKQLVRNRLVNSLDSSLDKDKYEDYTLPLESREYTCLLEKPRGRKSLGRSITWTNDNEALINENLSLTEGHLLAEARSVDTELKSWELFISLCTSIVGTVCFVSFVVLMIDATFHHLSVQIFIPSFLLEKELN